MNVATKIGPVYHPQLIQGSDEWHAMRCGLLTASEIGLILTPTQKIANNDRTRSHVWEIAAQRITGFTEPGYVGIKMQRGWDDEIDAAALYSKTRAPVTPVGFVTDDRWGFTIGYSPDGLVGSDGLIEIKSRDQKFQIETIVKDEVPIEHVLQCQAGLLVTGRKWLDYISYSGGLPMAVIRVEPIPEYQEAIIEAAIQFEAKVLDVMREYHATMAVKKYPATERKVEMEIY